MVDSRRRAEQGAEYAARNSVPSINFSYSPVISRAATEYTPTLFAMFQEQYGRIMEYRLELVQGSASSTTISFIAYKMHDGQRLDDRVVNANGGAGEVECDCKWWGTIGLLCRHALTVMHHLATFGCVKFQTLPSIYIKDRWKRSARNAFHIVIQRPLSRVENEEEWFVRASAEFGAIVRKAVRFESLRPLIDLKANELACMIQESLLIIDAHSVVNPSQGEQNRSVPRTTKGKSIATKNPLQPKPSKNTTRFKAAADISRMKQRKKYKTIREKEAADEQDAKERALVDQLAAAFAGRQAK
ncbi:Protein FAR1-RELATED SEQUENCE 9 [Linum perenne]